MNEDLEFRIKFIKEVEKNPCLYDPNHEDYNNKWKIDLVWGEIGLKFGDNVSAYDCKNKWRSIRCSYNRSLASQSRSYYLADQLSFLNPFLKNAPDKIEFNKELDAEDDDSTDHLGTNDDSNARDPMEVPLIKTELADDSNSDEDDDNYILSRISKGTKRASHLDSRDTANRPQKKRRPLNRSASEHYALSLVPFLETMTQRQHLAFQRGVVDLIEKIKYGSE